MQEILKFFVLILVLDQALFSLKGIDSFHVSSNGYHNICFPEEIRIILSRYLHLPYLMAFMID